MPINAKHCLLLLTLLATPLHQTKAQSHNLCVASPDWGIFVTDYGYADEMVDLRTVQDLNLKGREYLSGEWANAIAYHKGGVPTATTWLEPSFRFPDWPSNSNFTVSSPIQSVGTNVSGFNVYQSVISNPDWEITISSEVIDTHIGIQQGMTPASSAIEIDPPSTSSRYVFQQRLDYKNVSGQTLDNVYIFQLLHSLSALASLYDDRQYPTAGSAAVAVQLDSDYHYDSTLIGKDTSTGSFIDPSPCLPQPANLSVPEPGVFHYDKLALHSRTQPVGYDSGYYGDRGIGDNHIFGKPSTGSHLNIESGSLNNLDLFDPGDADYPNSPYFISTFGATHLGDLWVAAAQQHSLGSVNDDGTVSFTYLLSLHSQTVDLRAKGVVPLLPAPAQAALALILLLTALRQLRR